VTASDATVTSSSRLDAVEAGLDVDRSVANLDMAIVPGFLHGALRFLAPRRLEESAFFGRLTGARLRLTPERVGFSTAYLSHDARVWRYERVLESPSDLDVVPFESPRRALESGARVTFRPLESVTARIGMNTGRDLLDPDRATPLALERQAMHKARGQFGGVEMGWERDRVVTSDAAYRPVIADWIRPSMSWSSRFGQRRTPAHLAVQQSSSGPDAELQRTFHTDSRWTRGVVFDPAGAMRALTGISAPDEADRGRTHDDGARADGPGDRSMAAGLVAMLETVRPIEVTWTEGVGSRFERELAEPGLGYQLGMGRLDGVRFIGTDTAALAHRHDAFRVRSGLRLGPGLELGVGFGEMENRVHDRHVGRRDHTERSWPDVQLSWRDMPMPGLLRPLLTRWSFSTGFVRTARSTVLRGEVPRSWERLEGTIPLEVRLGFTSGLGLSYITSLTTGDGQDPTGLTEQDGRSQGIDLSGRFRAPFGLAETLFPAPLRLSLGYDSSAERQCRIAGNRPPPAPCTPFIDHASRRVNLTFSTLLSQLHLGVQGSYVDRRSFIGTEIGSSQLQLGLFGQFNLQAGSFPGR
jgi:hypothetical protein